MISSKELGLFDTEYFKVIGKSGLFVTVQSRNTKHYWHMEVAEYKKYRNFKLYHKHNITDSYHRHRDQPSIDAAIKNIKNHDAFQLNGRKYTQK